MYPSGYSGAAAIAEVQNRTGEYTYPLPTQILDFLNRGLEQAAAAFGPTNKYAAVATTPGTVKIALPADIMDITSMSWSTGDPTQPGTIVYPLTQLEQVSQMDFAMGLPGVGIGPPVSYFIISDYGGIITIQLYPSATNGQVNVYYRGRPTLWADATGESSTDVDTAFQEAAIIWACSMVCANRQRKGDADSYKAEYQNYVENTAPDQARRRTVPKSGRVRDVYAQGWPGVAPWWW
jgi:hypothetical protein